MTRTPPTRVQQAVSRLKSSGKRMTAQRALLLRIIANSPRHWTAQEIYERARERDPRINLATVYRTLAVLKEMEIVSPRYEPDHRREQFESKPAAEHFHFTCTECGHVIEFESELVPQLRARLAGEVGAEVLRTCICLEGRCAACRKDQARGQTA